MFPFHTWEGSNRKKHASQSNSDDVSASASLIEKTLVTFVNYSATDVPAFTPARGSNELSAAGNANVLYKGLTNNARFAPLFTHMRIQVSGQDYPSADGLNSADVAELMAYTETVDGMSVGVDLEKYASY